MKTCCEKVDVADIESEYEKPKLFVQSSSFLIELSDSFVTDLFIEHCHKPRTEGQDRQARKKLIIASILCILFIVVEVIGN